jgi:HTH-type transcriptional regulator/antitoxin MqsA
MSETRIHPETGKLLRRDVRAQVVSFGTEWRRIEVAGWYPDDDSDSIHSGGDLAESNKVFQALRVAYGAHVREIRKFLNLTQEEAGDLIGGGRRAFQKYESGATPPSTAAMNLIEMLARYPDGLDLIRSLRAPLGEVSAPPGERKVESA